MFQQLRREPASDEIVHAFWDRPTLRCRYDSSAPGIVSDFNTLVTSNIIQSVALWARDGWRKVADQNRGLTFFSLRNRQNWVQIRFKNTRYIAHSICGCYNCYKAYLEPCHPASPLRSSFGTTASSPLYPKVPLIPGLPSFPGIPSLPNSPCQYPNISIKLISDTKSALLTNNTCHIA
jgi:hypothetical protein